MRINRTTIIVAPFIAMAMIFSACQATPTSTATLSAGIKEITGTVGVKQAGATSFTPATTNSTLQQDGSVQTGSDGRVRLDLSTGTIIRLSPSSLFTLVSNKPSNNSWLSTFQLNIGRVFIILNGGSVDVNTPSGVASVRGSFESITADPVTHNVTVTCLEGHCSASNPAGSVDLTSGEKTVLFHLDPATGQYTPPGVEPMSPEDYQNWLNENPEAQAIINAASGTFTALAATEAPATTAPAATEAPATQPPTTGGGGSGPRGCGITGPLAGSDLPKYGPVHFSWNSQDGAAKYIVTFHFPNGGITQVSTTDTYVDRYTESMNPGGSYSWDVTAIDASGTHLCQSESSSFTKLPSEPDKPKPPPEPPTTPPAG